LTGIPAPGDILRLEKAAVVQITAHVRNATASHEVSVSTAGVSQSLQVPTKVGARGSAVNGGEFLMLALATCFCNDIYREAARLKIQVDGVEVEATGNFEGVGLAASGIRYRARIDSPASESDIAVLLSETDAVSEIQNTVRAGVAVTLMPWTPEPRTRA
jgi:organic hydroperoxide reductase OsmC/OhrA